MDALAVETRDAPVDVIIALLSARECEVAELETLFKDEAFQFFSSSFSLGSP